MKKLIFSIYFALFLTHHAWAGDINTTQVEVLAKTNSSWDKKRLPDYPSGQPEVTILRIKIPPGVKLPMHHHPVINAGVLLTGELTVVTQDNQTLHLKAGQSIVEVVDTWHYGKNEGTETAEILVFYAGVLDKPITLKE